MRIACLQFAPQVGDVNNNLIRADAVLSRANITDIDLLVLPELAFSGYNFRSLQHISPFLEPTCAGITSLWARTTALKYNTFVVVGYPEKVDVTPKWPADPEYYNSAITVNPDGETIANYRKSFLYYTDETWALEGPTGFYSGMIPRLGNVAMGICMDLNPYRFEAPWIAWEFAHHVLHRQTNLVILSMAWLTREDAESYSRSPRDPDLETLSYWLSRLEPVIRAEGEEEIIAVFANRSGVEDDAVYAGTSAVLGIQAGEVKVYGILGRGDRNLLVVDTKKIPQMQVVSEPKARLRAQQAMAESQVKQSSRAPDSRSSDSSGSTLDSDQSMSTPGLSISTDASSLDLGEDYSRITPPLENYIITPTSPNGSHSVQAYCRNECAQPRPCESETDLALAQPRSGNTSRSTGPVYIDSPILSNSFTPEVRTTREEAQRNLEKVRTRTPSNPSQPDQIEVTPVSEEMQPLPDSRRTQHQGSILISDDVQPISSPDAVQSFPSRSNSESSSQSSSGSESDSTDNRQGRAGFARNQDRFFHAASVVPKAADDESSFTRNSLGPRSRHVSPRPKSTIW